MSKGVREGLKARWRTHAQMLGNFSPDGVGHAFDRLCAAYTEPHRHYHTLDHLHAIFDCLEQHGETIVEPAHVTFAAWYHDAIYDPRRSDNEERSAALAGSELATLGAPGPMRDDVMHLIRATRDHRTSAGSSDGDIFLDADLAIIGAPDGDYRAYAAGVRREFAHLADSEWNAGRAAFLRQLAAAPRVFLTDTFEKTRATQARRNIAWELSTIEGAA